MKTLRFAMFLLYTGYAICGSLGIETAYGQGETVMVLGGNTGWRIAENRAGVTEVNGVRPNPVLILSSATGVSTVGYSAASGVWGNFAQMDESALDVSLSFDENNSGLFRDSIRRYGVSVSGVVEAVDRRYSRAGSGAALFSGNSHVRVQPQSGGALFAQGSRLRDFSIEFWLNPLNMDNGEQILSWTSVGSNGSQRINCVASRNRLSWTFTNFFINELPRGAQNINLEFSGRTPVQPKAWSHHLIRFDASTGMLEYVVDGVSEAIVYATPTRRENSEVYTPIIGSNGAFVLGERFVGLMDEFKVHSACISRQTIQKYPAPGGSIETRAIDLGHNNSGVVRIDASGGRISTRSRSVTNEFKTNGRFRFSCDAEMSFYIRACENQWDLPRQPWTLFTPGQNVSARGRYVQIAVYFYPSRDGETSPYLQDLRIVYVPGEPPLPPRNVIATAFDGGVILRWRNSPSDITGYNIYYSSVRGELFGSGAVLGSSPIKIGNVNYVKIDGLQNGTLYYFRIAAYDDHNEGEFSGEVTARPLLGLPYPE